MANEFKVKKGLIVQGSISGSTVLDIQGTQGQLFSITDQLSGSLFSVNDISGIPVIEAFSNGTVKIGLFNSEPIIISGTQATVIGTLIGTASTVVNSAITNTKLANMSTKTYKGRTSAGTGIAEDVTIPQLVGDLSIGIGGLIPYTGASSNTNLGSFGLTATTLSATTYLGLDADDVDDTNTLHKFVDQNDLDILSTVLHSRATGLASGGFMTINTDTAKFDIASGFGYIVDGHTDVENPSTVKVTWTAKTANTLPNIATQEATYIAIDSNGDIFTSVNPLTSTERRDYIRLGAISHVNNTVISSINNQPTVNIEVGAQVQDILEILGFRSISGNRIFPVSTNLKIKKEVGTVFKPGSNFNNLNTQPHSFILPAQDPITFRYITQTGVEGANVTDINPTIYDLNGSFTAIPATATLASIQRIYIFQDGIVRVQPGQRYFANLNQAITSINSDEFITDANISNNGLYLGAIIMIYGTTSLSNLAQAVFVPSQGTTTNGSVPTPPLGYTAEDVANKQNTLVVDGTGVKYPTVDAVNVGLATKVGLLQVTGQTLTVASWTLVGSFYESNLSNATITALSIVNAIPNNASANVVRVAELLPSTLSSAGTVKFYSRRIPTANITITINIIK